MNRYTAEGIIADAAQGKRVAFVGRRAGDVFDALAAAAEPFSHKVYRAKGHQRIEFANGGRVTLHATGRSGRGFTADVVVLDESVKDDERVLGDVMPMLAPSNGEVIRA